jgi:hypothetical protein
MANDDKKTKPEPASKNEAAPKKEAASKAKNTSAAEPAKAEGAKAQDGDTGAAAHAGYSRGEGQKPVTQAYKDNWNAIFGKKKKR